MGTPYANAFKIDRSRDSMTNDVCGAKSGLDRELIDREKITFSEQNSWPSFAISSLSALGSMLAKLANIAKMGISLSACLIGFGCRPSLAVVALMALPHPLLRLPHLGCVARKTPKVRNGDFLC